MRDAVCLNLRQVAGADNLGAGAGADDQGLHLLGRQVFTVAFHARQNDPGSCRTLGRR